MPTSTAPDANAPLLLWAQWYAEQGWPVFPCRGKMPLTPHGFKDASEEFFQVTQWWTQWPDANIGSPAGLHWWALDVDPRHHGDDTLFFLEQTRGSLPPTLLSHTGGGGSHYLWAMPAEGIINKAHVGNGLDVQGAGSYIILPPSIHPDTGTPYVWDVVNGPDDLMPQAAPDWLVALVSQPEASPSPAAPIPAGAPIMEGMRETTLVRMAGSLRHTGATGTEILAALCEINQR